MSVGNDKMAKDGAATKSDFVTSITSAIDLTALVIRCRQIPFSFLVQGVQLFCSSVVSTVTLLVGIVRPGRAIQAVALVIGSTTTKFKLNAALTAVMPYRPGNALPVVVNKAIADNIAFSSAFTINLAAATGIFYGAVRVQMDSAGTVTTKVAAQNQAYISAGAARYACPAADSDKFDMGMIVIPTATGMSFTAQTDDLNGAHVGTVLYEGIAAGFVNVCASDPSFVSANLVRGTLITPETDRGVSQIGGLLVVKETTSHTGVVTDGVLDVGIRAWPLNGEVAPATQE